MVDLANVSSCALFSFDDHGKILQANTTTCALLGIAKEQLLQEKINTIFTTPTLIFFQTHLYPLLKVEQSLDEIFITLKSQTNREVPVILSARRVVTGEWIENVCSCLTIYNRKNYEDEILAAKKEAERALQENTLLVETQSKLQENVRLLDEKMLLLQQYNEMLKEISHAVSHELQEPVRKLHLFTDLLLGSKQNTVDEGKKSKVHAQIQRIKQILSGLQNYVWLEDRYVHTTEIDLAEVVKGVQKTLAAENPGLDFSLNISALPKIQGSYDQCKLLFYQLLSNAIEYRSPERPLQIKFAASLINRNQFKLLQDHYTYRAYYKIDCADNGIGFDPKYAGYIFQLFKKLNPRSKGLGVGLTLCKKIVLNHDGIITAFSEPGKGSTFTLYFPAEKATVGNS